MRTDILIDDTGDLVFENGDFKIGASDMQHVVLLVNTEPGSWKRYPKVGVGATNFISSSGTGAALRQAINVQLEKDGFTNILVELSANLSTGQYDYNVSAEFNE